MKKPYYSVGFEEFSRLASQGNLIPIYQEILADFETPVSAFSKINTGPTAFLFESVEGGENWARYSFLGSNATLVMLGRSRGVGCPTRPEDKSIPIGIQST